MQSFTIEEFKKIHQAWKESGLSVRDYCTNTGIKDNLWKLIGFYISFIYECKIIKI